MWFGPDYSDGNVLTIEDPAPEVEGSFGAALAFGDITGDGIDDCVVGKSGARWEGKSWVGEVTIFPGPDYNDPIYMYSPLRGENSIFGSEVVIGDINGDGLNDLVVGEYYATVNGIGSAGRAWLFLGKQTAVDTWMIQD